MAEVLEPENPGMHTTDTVDFDVVISVRFISNSMMAPRFCSGRETA